MGVLSRNRGPYAPQRAGAVIDWGREQALLDAGRAQERRVTDEALDTIHQFRLDNDPLSQLVRRAQAGEDQTAALRALVEQQGEQLTTILNHLKGTSNNG